MHDENEQLRPCKCGATNLRLDYWYAPKAKLRLERFVRCLDCDETGPSCPTEKEARQRWNVWPE